MKFISLEKSNKPNKKLVIKFSEPNRTIHFGSKYSSTLDNLVPICMLCNTSMSKHDLKEFITKYNLHHGLDEL